MSDLMRATETFACEHGLIHWHSEWPADHEVVQQFPQFFEAITVGEPATPPAPVKRVSRKKAAPDA